MPSALGDPDDWLPELKTVMIALGNALQGQRPTRELLCEIAPKYTDAISGHRTQAMFRSRGTAYARKSVRPSHNRRPSTELPLEPGASAILRNDQRRVFGHAHSAVLN